MILSHIRYGITVWHNTHKALRKRIQACANKFVKMIFSMGRRDSAKNVMIENNIPSVNQIYNLEVGKLMQKLALGIIPPPFIDMFGSQIRESSMVTRSASH